MSKKIITIIPVTWDLVLIARFGGRTIAYFKAKKECLNFLNNKPKEYWNYSILQVDLERS